jgi:hypothetical protein
MYIVVVVGIDKCRIFVGWVLISTYLIFRQAVMLGKSPSVCTNRYGHDAHKLPVSS